MNTDILLVLIIVTGAVALFVTEKLRVDLTALCILLALLLLGLIRPEQALYGFASPATATVAAMFVLSAGLARTGTVAWLARRIDAVAGSGRTALVVVLCSAVAVLSAFIVNTATVAVLIPVAIALAEKRKVPESQVLMPLSFASQFGGVCTLIGTSTNILVNSFALEQGLPAFGLFEFAPLGLVMCGMGIGYLALVSGWLLPHRRGAAQQTDKYRLADYLTELQVKEDSPLEGKRWRELEDIRDLTLIKIVRGGKSTWRATATPIKAGDVLLIHGHANSLMKAKDALGLETRGDAVIDDQRLSSNSVELVEALISPQSRLVGHSLRSADFRRRYGCVTLAIQRRGKLLRERLEDIRLDAGDTLLLQCRTERVPHIMQSADLIVTNKLTELFLRKDRALIALGLVAAVVLLAAFKVVPILVAALIGGVGMVLAGCLTLEEAYEAIDWKVVFLLGGTLPLGLAMQQTGTAAWLVNTLVAPLAQAGPIVLLAVIYIVTAVLTETMSNNAAAIILAPLALSLAASLGVDARPFLVAITFAASTSFATPIGYQTNTMVYAPGGYRFLDYTKVGVPLNLLFWVTATILIPLLWPF